MTRGLIVGYDEPAAGDDALRLARLLGQTLATPATVVNITPDDSFWMGVAEFERAREADAERISARAEETLGDLAAETRMVASGRSPARILTELAEQENAAAIVIGSTLHGPLGKVLFGRTGERLLHGAPCAVAVAPRGYASSGEDGLERIGIGYDGGTESRIALDRVIELAESSGAALRLLTVVPGRHPQAQAAGYLHPLEQGMREHLQAATDVAKGRGLEVDARLLQGDPAEILLGESDDLDLLVVGSRGYGPVRSVLLGGVSSELMRAAASPILILPRAGAGSAEGVVERHHQHETADQAH